MVKTVLIAIGAGAAAALLFGSLFTGTPLAFSLFVLTPVPIAIVGIGWGSVAGGLAAVVAAVALALVTAPAAGGLLLLLFAAPVAWLSHLAGLWRENSALPDGREWYPLGGILTHAAGIVAAVLIVVGLLLGFDPDQAVANGIQAIQAFLAEAGGTEPVPSAEDLEPLVRLYVGVMPYSAAAGLLLLHVFALWLAGRVNAASGRLSRPWIPLWSTRVSATMAGVFAVSLVVSFLSGPIGLAARPVAGASGFAMLLIGLAVLHALTRGTGGRTLLLVATYLTTIVVSLPALPLIAVGLAESTIGIRNRFPNRPTV